MTPAVEHSHIKGWGADLNPANRPAVPKKRTPPNGTGAHWKQIEQQIPRIKIYHSVERPSITPVFGTSTPPAGLSGRIRDVAYQFSENDVRHWFLLIFADRVNMVEGIFQDLSRGHIPNIFAEMGLKSEFKYNRKAAVKKVAIAVGVIGVAAMLFRARRQRKALA
jgi:hypothetical protein